MVYYSTNSYGVGNAIPFGLQLYATVSANVVRFQLVWQLGTHPLVSCLNGTAMSPVRYNARQGRHVVNHFLTSKKPSRSKKLELFLELVL